LYENNIVRIFDFSLTSSCELS